MYMAKLHSKISVIFMQKPTETITGMIYADLQIADDSQRPAAPLHTVHDNVVYSSVQKNTMA